MHHQRPKVKVLYIIMLLQLNIIGIIEKSFNTCMDDIRQWVRVTKVKKNGDIVFLLPNFSKN